MKNKISQSFFLVVIVILVAVIFLYGAANGDIRDFGSNSSDRSKPVEFNSQERAYLKQHDSIKIYVDTDLQFMMNEDGTGFLWNYMRDIFEPAGVNVALTDNISEADCRMMIINDRIRRTNMGFDYTSPVFQVDGAFFIRKDAPSEGNLKGVILAGRLKADDINDIKYDGRQIEFIKASTAEEVVVAAVKNNADVIVGDRTAILAALKNNSRYIAVEDTVYSMNTCLMVPESESGLYGILNACICAADRYHLTYEASQKWFAGNGPRFMDDSYENFYMLVLIIFAAVLIAFFIYYQANKNLYHELNDRMVKLAESKQELKTTFNGVKYYLAETDLEGSILDINRAFYNFVNTDTVNRKVWDVIDIAEKYKARIQKIVDDAGKGIETHSIEIRLKRQTIVIDVFPIENVRGSVEKLLFMAMDVTNERMAERQLLQDNKMIAVGQLAAGVAHEIRNPLGIIRNYCYVLKNMDDDSVREKAVEQIEKAVENSGAIINSLLNFSRVSTKSGETINVEEHIWSLIQLNYNILKKKNIDLEVECDEDVVTFLAVESLDMILINLISNATDAMSDNGKLTIRVVRYTDSFEINVEDTGTGIEEDILQEIFNPFFTTKGNKKGNGLGLYIVYNETNKMNGNIEVESKVGEGTRFRLTLPLIEDTAGKEGRND
ncbi:MAG: ATP-binding protein [Bacillota bacterium]|nr:ATP-binding protein [Bacillota bacterium]